MARLPIPADIKKDIIKRRKALSKNMPRFYMSHIKKSKHTQNQIWDFVNGKTFNVNILEELEGIFNK